MIKCNYNIKRYDILKQSGRPKKDVKKTVLLQIRLTEDENKQIEELAKNLNMNKSKFVRTLLLADDIDTDFLKKWHTLPIAQHLTEMSDYLNNTKVVDFGGNVALKIKKDEEIVIDDDGKLTVRQKED